MREKKAGRKIILAAFIVIICLPWPLWFIWEKNTDNANYENRNLASRPQIGLENYTRFPEEYTDYINDHLPFRNNLVALNGWIDLTLGHPSNPQVIIGKQGWLFYDAPGNGDPVACYQGTNLLSQEQMEQLVGNCVLQRDKLAEMGKELIIFIAPNKERIYSEYMPAWLGEPADQYKVKQIVDYIRANTDLRVVYPYDELVQAKAKLQEYIYFKTDTHWNMIGAYVGTQALLRELGITMPAIDSLQIRIQEIEKKEGDLAAMLGLAKQLRNTDQIYDVSGFELHHYQSFGGDGYTLAAQQAEGADPRKIFVIHDSFAYHGLFQYIGSQFNESFFKHYSEYSEKEMLSINPDIVIYETVERMVDNLATFSVEEKGESV